MYVNIPLDDTYRQGRPWYSVYFGAAVILIAIVFLIGPMSLVINQVPTTATVDYLSSVYSQRSASTSYFAHVTYQVDGEETRGSLPQAFSPTTYSEGKHVSIVYDRTHPTQVADQNAWLVPFLFPVIALLAGVMWLVLGIVFVRKRARREAAAASS